MFFILKKKKGKLCTNFFINNSTWCVPLNIFSWMWSAHDTYHPSSVEAKKIWSDSFTCSIGNGQATVTCLISFFEECDSLISLTLYLAQIFAYTLRTSDHLFNGSDWRKIYQFASSKIEVVVTSCGHRCGPSLDQSCTFCLYFSSFNAHMHSSLFHCLSLLFK